MNITLSASNKPYKNKGYFKDFKPLEVSSLKELGELMLTHSLCNQIFTDKPMTNAQGDYPAKWRKTTDAVIGTGNIVYLDIDNSQIIDGVECAVGNPVTLEQIEEAFKKQGWGCVVTYSKSALTDKSPWEKFHVAAITSEPVPNYKTDRKAYRDFYDKLTARLMLKNDHAMTSAIQNLTPAIGREVLSIIQGSSINITEVMSDAIPPENKGYAPRKTRIDGTTVSANYISMPHDTPMPDDAPYPTLGEIINHANELGDIRFGCPFGVEHSNGGKGYGHIHKDGIGVRCSSCQTTMGLDVINEFDVIKDDEELVDKSLKGKTLDLNIAKKIFEIDVADIEVTPIEIEGIDFPIIYRGATHTIFGIYGTNKTSIAIILAGKVAEKEDMHVFYLDGENNGRKMREFAEEHGVNYIPSNISSNKVQLLLENKVDCKNAIIILDSFSAMLPEGKSNNDAKDTTETMRTAVDLSAKLGATVIVIEHATPQSYDKDGHPEPRSAKMEGSQSGKLKLTHMAYKAVPNDMGDYKMGTRLQVTRSREPDITPMKAYIEIPYDGDNADAFEDLTGDEKGW